MSKAAELAALIGSQSSLSNRNLIINGAMQVAQRGTSAFSISTAANTYTLDRWRANASGGGVFSVQQDSDSPTGFIESSKITVTTADSSIGSSDFYHFRQTIEGYNFSSLGYGASDAKTMTISFYVKSSVTGVYNVLFRNNAGNRGYLTTYTINSANTWERKTITVEGDVTGTWPTDNTGSLIISYSFGGNATATTNQWGTAIDEKSSGTVDLIATLNATWQITGVQLELGEQATPFEHRSYGDELARCQRYYYENPAFTGVGLGSSAIARATATHPTSMRASPSLTIVGSPEAFDGFVALVVTGVSANYSNTILFNADLSNTGSGSSGRAVCVAANLYTSSNKIKVDAEL